MADIKIVGGLGSGREREECGEDCGIQPPFALTTTTIYARPNGSDKCGDGSLANPYRTFQRAIRDVPSILPPGATYIVDITDLGVETLPTDYVFPVIQSGYVYGGAYDVSPPWLGNPAFQVLALPKLALAPADAVIAASDLPVITSNPDTNLIIVTIPAARSSWAAGALKGKMFIRTIGSANTSCCIYDSNDGGGAGPSQLFLCNTAAFVPPLAAGEVFQIVEPSATLEAPPPTNGDNIAIRCCNINSLAFKGIRFRCSVPDTAFSLMIADCPAPLLELCDVDGLFCTMQSEQIALFSTTLRMGIDAEGSPVTPRRAYWTGVGTGSVGYLFMEGGAHIFRTTVLDGCVPIENSVFAGVTLTPAWVFFECLFSGSLGNAIHCTGGRYEITNTRIDGSSSDAISAEKGTNFIICTQVTGANNGGVTDVGIRATDGAQVSVDAATTVTGGVAGNDVKSGSLLTATYAALALHQQYDLAPGPAGNPTTFDAQTGTRIFRV